MNKAIDEGIQSMIKYLSRLNRTQRQFVNRTTGLKGIMYRYLLTIKRYPGASQDFLAEFHAVDKSRVARIARELELLGYITRSPDENDRRLYRLFLTESGEEAHQRISASLMDWGGRIVEGLPAEAVAQAADTLAKMAENAAAEESNA